MSSKFESSVKVIPYSQEAVYNKLSDLNNLEAIKDRIPQDKVKDVTFDTDTLSFSAPPAGNISLKVAEREPFKCIKFQTTTSPVPFNLWIQIVPLAQEECKIKITIEVEINPFMKTMIQKPLEDGLEKMAEMIAAIPY